MKNLLVVFFICLLAGCATNQSPEEIPDPYEPVNRASYNFTDTLDRAFLKPVAEAYAEHTPQLVRTSITNFFDNLAYLNVVLNSFLQGKFDQGIADALRFIYNSTAGIGGLIDVGSKIGLEQHNEDLGQTLAVWGFGQGSYLYIPIKGPDSTRKLPDMATRTLLNPLTYVTGAVLFPLTAVNIINTRANLLDATNVRDEAAVDPYTFTREAYHQQRRFLIYDGNPPVEGYDDIFDNGDGEEGILKIE